MQNGIPSKFCAGVNNSYRRTPAFSFLMCFILITQFSGINGVMYYTPQILEQAGVEVLLSSLGIGSESASFLISAFTTLLMLPCIAVAMRFVDVAGRRLVPYIYPLKCGLLIPMSLIKF